ncbi:MAG: hypothetical protein F4160_06205, partial [Rhodospirillaceae bacterium]|nr:hypothetical protein [Rhodospirillaceae bacterium]MYF85496.1 hypothetical protein [Rhodospirillaceae bacterium]MYH36375.1 hypothetical protein [Rhodospirillaceae bacterium]
MTIRRIVRRQAWQPPKRGRPQENWKCRHRPAGAPQGGGARENRKQATMSKEKFERTKPHVNVGT